MSNNGLNKILGFLGLDKTENNQSSGQENYSSLYSEKLREALSQPTGGEKAGAGQKHQLRGAAIAARRDQRAQGGNRGAGGLQPAVRGAGAGRRRHAGTARNRIRRSGGNPLIHAPARGRPAGSIYGRRGPRGRGAALPQHPAITRLNQFP